MKKCTGYVDPFLGNSEMELPIPEGVAATWFFIKAQTGNTHPGACLPFGMISCCAYSGAFVSGYGLNAPNCDGKINRIYEKYCASGFTHFQQSGTGMIDDYYNYFKVIPLSGDMQDDNKIWEIKNENSHPGYYSANLKGTGIKVELTVAEKMAFHRYTYTNKGRRSLKVDFSSGGLIFENMKTYPEKSEIKREADNIASGYVKMLGVSIYVYMILESKNSECTLYHGDRKLKDNKYGIGSSSKDHKPFGVEFILPKGSGGKTEYQLRIGFSLKSTVKAKKNMKNVKEKSFDEVSKRAAEIWENYLSVIKIKGGSEKQKIIFYSAFYHSLIKPCDFSGESPFWKEQEYFPDMATLWDQYKTQMPLILTLYPEKGKDIINSMIAAKKYNGKFPLGTTLSDDFSDFTNQAKALCHYIIADAFNRKVSGIDWNEAKDLMIKDIKDKKNIDFIEKGFMHPYTHTLDLSGACFCTAQIAKELGDNESYEEMMLLSENWKNVYGEDGILGDSEYYEGGAWNYSFRLLHNMNERILLSKGRFIQQLDRFFGYGASPVIQPGDKQDQNYVKHMQLGKSLNRFEGFNNESDMETPYSYIYAGRHDRLAEIIRAGLKFMFTTGRGGLPGNDDSGGLSSCCMWNMIGLFPVVGQAIMLIGSPIFDEIDLKVGRKNFTIKALNNSEKNIYVQSAKLNGNTLKKAYISIDVFMAGGKLILEMGPNTSKWACD